MVVDNKLYFTDQKTVKEEFDEKNYIGGDVYRHANSRLTA